MSREAIQIPLDKIGIITNIDAKDIPDHYLTDSLNLDPDAPVGTIQSIKTVGSNMTSSGTYKDEYAKILNSTIVDTWVTPEFKTNVITDKAVVADFYGVAAGTANTLTDISCMMAHNGDMRVAKCTDTAQNLIYYYPKASIYGRATYFYATEIPPSGGGAVDYTLGDTLTDGGKFAAVLTGNYTGVAATKTIIFRWDYGTPGSGEWEISVNAGVNYYVMTDEELRDGYDAGYGLTAKLLYDSGTLASAQVITLYYVFGADETVTLIPELENELLPPTSSEYDVGMADPKYKWIGISSNIGYSDEQGDDQPIDKDSNYEYKISLIYDGVQEGPLSQRSVIRVAAPTGPNFQYIQVCVDILTYAVLTTVMNTRVTGVRLYRRRRSTNDTTWSQFYEVGTCDLTQLPYGFIEFAANPVHTTTNQYWLTQMNSDGDYDLNDNFGQADYDRHYWKLGDNFTSGSNEVQNAAYCMFIDNNMLGPSYYENTGFSEDTKTMRLDYMLCEQLNGSNYIARIRNNDELSMDGKFAIIKSQDGCLDMFNHYDNVMRLPEPPMAIKSFNNRLYAFGRNTVYVINPNLFIEDTIDGIGISARTTTSYNGTFGVNPVVNEYGMFWTDDVGAYWHNGKQIVEISDLIKTTFAAAYNGSVTYKSCVYDSKKKCMLFGYLGTNKYIIYVFHIPTKQWCYWEIPITTGDTTGLLFTGNRNDTYIITNTIVSKLFDTSANYLPGSFTTKEYGENMQYKKWYKINSDYTLVSGDTLTVTYTADGSATSPTTSTSISLANLKNKKFKVKFAWTPGQATATIIKAIEIIFRKLIGYR